MRYLVSLDDRTRGDANSGRSTTGRLHGKVVDFEFVQSYADIETRRFFINLGGTEERRKSKTGVITIKSVSPADDNGVVEVRTVKFTPVSGNEG